MAIISTDQREKLGTAFNNLIDLLRLEMRNVMFREHGDIWAEECRDALSDAQRSLWDHQHQGRCQPGRVHRPGQRGLHCGQEQACT